MNLIQGKLSVAYFAWMTTSAMRMPPRWCDRWAYTLSQMQHNAELYLLPTEEEKADRPRLKYGAKLTYQHLPEALRVSSTSEEGYCTEVYQATCLHKHFADLLNVVIIVRTHLESGRVGHVVLFSSDLNLEGLTLIDYYSLRFQIEFTFRDAKQYFVGGFHGVQETSILNAAGLSFFMVNLSRHCSTACALLILVPGSTT